MQRVEVFDLAFQFVKRIDQRAKPRDFIDIALGALAVVPKIGGRHPRFERGQFFLQFGQVKETSAARARETSNLRRQRWWFRLPWGKQYAAPFVCHVERSVVIPSASEGSHNRSADHTSYLKSITLWEIPHSRSG